MKKNFAFMLVALLMIGIVAGCGSQSNAPAGGEKTQLILATGGTAGTYYPYGGAIAQIWNSKIPNMNVTAQATGASIENLRLVQKKEAELAIVQSDMADYAINGKESFKEKLTNLNGIAVMYPEFIQVVARTDSGINTIADLKGKKVGVGAPGSGAEANFRQLLSAYDMDYKALNPQYLSFSESADQFKDKRVDAFIVVAGIPNSAIMDIGAQHDITIVAIPDDVIAKLVKQYPFLSPATIPANTYKGITKDIKTVAVNAILVVNPQVKEEVVYNLTKALVENQPELAKAHAKGKELNIKSMSTGMSIPLHPGAMKYYKEKGILK